MKNKITYFTIFAIIISIISCDDNEKKLNSGQTDISSICGNSKVETAESCDDGNKIDGDNCDSLCQVEIPQSCGDGIVSGDEYCDFGESGNPVEKENCNINCTEVRCGDGLINASAGESCEEGGIETATCDDDCTTVSCGDGNFNESAGEECDDGNANDDDACDSNCKNI